jgi:hypothetical protein
MSYFSEGPGGKWLAILFMSCELQSQGADAASVNVSPLKGDRDSLR